MMRQTTTRAIKSFAELFQKRPVTLRTPRIFKKMLDNGGGICYNRVTSKRVYFFVQK
jgi:hypothetical protein